MKNYQVDTVRVFRPVHTLHLSVMPVARVLLPVPAYLIIWGIPNELDQSLSYGPASARSHVHGYGQRGARPFYTVTLPYYKNYNCTLTEYNKMADPAQRQLTSFENTRLRLRMVSDPTSGSIFYGVAWHTCSPTSCPFCLKC